MKRVLSVCACLLMSVCLVAAFAPSASAATVAKPAKARIASVASPAVSKLTVKVKKAKRAKGYRYIVATDKAFTENVKTKTTTAKKATFAKLKAGKKYYVKAKAYTTKANGKKAFGPWSAVKSQKVKKAQSEGGGEADQTPTVVFDSNLNCVTSVGGSVRGNYLATVSVRNFGTFKMLLNADVAPISVWNFQVLANSGFYDGLPFHRVVSGFALQGGDPLGNGQGGSNTRIFGEFSANGVSNSWADSFGRGVVGMARTSDDPNSATSQFFITLATTAGNFYNLSGQYAAFGYVDDAGMQVVDAIAASCAGAVDETGLIVDRALQPVIESIRVERAQLLTAASL